MYVISKSLNGDRWYYTTPSMVWSRDIEDATKYESENDACFVSSVLETSPHLGPFDWNGKPSYEKYDRLFVKQHVEKLKKNYFPYYMD